MSLMIRLSFTGSEIMKTMKDLDMKGTQIKGQDTIGQDDLVTEADLQIQELIVREIGQKYSGLQIIGEESMQPKQKYMYKDGQSNIDNLSLEGLFKGEHE